MHQRDLFDHGLAEPLARPNPTGDLPGPPDAAQRDNDCRRILEALRSGPLTNVELQEIRY